MNLRTLSLAVVVLVAACVAVYFIQRPPAPAPADPRVGQPLLAADVASAAAELDVADQGKKVTLKKQADGTWILPEYYGFPADFSKLSRFIGDLTEAKIQRFVSSRPDRLSRLEFKDASVALRDAQGKESWRLTLGKTAEGGGRYVRFGQEEKAYQANLSAWLDTEAKNWADSTLLNLKTDDIAALELGFPDGAAVKASRAKKEDAWASSDAPAGKELKPEKISSILGNFVSLRFTDTSDPADAAVAAAHAHSRTLKLTTFDGKSYTLVLSRKPEEKKPKPKPATPPPAPAPATTPAGETAPAADAAKPAETKPAEPEFETIPAGPVFANITNSDPKAPLNALMQKRAFQIGEWSYTSLPATRDELWQDKPAPKPEHAEKSAPTTKETPAAADQATPTPQETPTAKDASAASAEKEPAPAKP
jgi:hypothetical protein